MIVSTRIRVGRNLADFPLGPGISREQRNEVEKIVEIPVDFFLDARNINMQTEIKIFNGNVVRVPAYIYQEHIIWGATAIMLSEFTFIIEKIKYYEEVISILSNRIFDLKKKLEQNQLQKDMT